MSARDDVVYKAGCLECDYRYYALSKERAINWAEAHAEEEGHSLHIGPAGWSK